jgi:putative endonuclease
MPDADRPASGHHLSTGKKGEEQACDYLCRQGLVHLESNYLCKIGEIDLVMRHGDTLIFVEVRQRKNNLYGSPLETVSAAKKHKLRRTAEHFLLVRKISARQALRFDVVGIVGTGADAQIDWVQNAF